MCDPGGMPVGEPHPRRRYRWPVRNRVTGHRRTLGLSVTVAFAGVLAAGCAAAPVSGEPSGLPERKLTDVLTSAYAEFSFPGAIAGVWSPAGEWVGSVGTATAGTEEALTPGHHTRIGSITKTFTVTLLLQEVSRGSLALDDTIGKFVSGLPNGERATLRDLAQMTSGIPSYTAQESFLSDHFDNVDRAFTARELLNYVTDLEPLFAPGTAYDYSNTNTVALGMAVEAATGKDLGSLFTERIIEPLGLTGTVWPSESAALPAPYLSGQTLEGSPEGELKDSTTWNPSTANAAGEMISTLADLGVWARALGTGEGILDPAAQALRLASFEENLAIPGNSPADVYGLGAASGDGWIGHVGEIAGYSSAILSNPTTQTSIVVLVNSNVEVSGDLSAAPVIMSRLREVMAAG